jgi:tripartite-type tricarboxylate transporter receptor subunit TctC
VAAPATAVPAKPAAATVVTPQPTSAPAKAVDYPTKGRAITLIVGWAAGGGTDIAARLVAAGMEKELGTPVQVVNRAGASTQVGMTELANAKPDGYTIGVTNQPTLVLIYLDPELKPAFTRKSFVPIANYVWDAMGIVVSKDSPNQSLKALIDAAKANPGKVKIATTGVKGVNPMALTQLEQAAKVEFARVGMESIPDITTGVLGGHLDAGFGGMSGWLSLSKAGNIRILGQTGTKDSKFFPDVKTMTAQGYDVPVVTVQGLAAPAGTQKEIVSILNNAVKKVAASDDFKKKMEEMALNVDFMDTAQYEAYWNELEKQMAPLMPKQ